MADKIFKWRGYLLAPYGFLLGAVAQPSKASLALGLVFALLGESLRIWGVGYAGKTTRKGILEAPFLVTGGPFSFVRHPLYLGNILIGLGGALIAVGRLAQPFVLVIFLAFLISYGLVYASLIPLEEKFLEEKFKEEYRRYKENVPRLIPFKKPFPFPQGAFSFKAAITSEIHTLIPFLVFLGYMAFKTR